MNVYLYIWLEVNCDYTPGMIIGTGTSLEDVRRKFSNAKGGYPHYDNCDEALTTEPSKIIPVLYDDAIAAISGGG